MRTIPVATLRSVFERLLQKLQAAGLEEVPVGDSDMYWYVPAPECYDMRSAPELNVGSLQDDISSLERLVENTERMPAYVDFDRLASLLRALSNELNPV
jgi:hypothetical protein